MSKFKVGDKVIIKSKSVPCQLEEYSYFIKYNPSINGHWIVNRINGDGSGSDIDNCICVSNRINGYNGCFTPQDLELYEEPSNEPIEQPKRIPDCVIHCPEEWMYMKMLDVVGWRNENGTCDDLWRKFYKEETCVRILDGKIDAYSPFSFYIKEANVRIYSFQNFMKEYFPEVKKSKTPLLIPSTPTLSPLIEMYQEALRHQDVLTGTIMSYSSGAGWSPQEVTLSKEVNKKPNKIKQMTNNIVEFAKNLTLSADEKLLREVGLHDDEGCYTEDALNIALNMESVEIGFKSYQDLCDSIPNGCTFSLLEAAKLLKKYEVQLLDMAKKLKEESKSNKK